MLVRSVSGLPSWRAGREVERRCWFWWLPLSGDLLAWRSCRLSCQLSVSPEGRCFQLLPEGHDVHSDGDSGTSCHCCNRMEGVDVVEK